MQKSHIAISDITKEQQIRSIVSDNDIDNAITKELHYKD